MGTSNPAGAPGGVIYEPRSLWSVQNIDTTAYNDDPNLGEGDVLQYIYQKFDRENFRNGTRAPITITRFAMIALNYLYAVAPDTMVVDDPGSAQLLDAAQQALNRTRFRISVPGRQSYSRFELSVPSYGVKPTWGEPVQDAPRANTFGVTRLNYDKPLFLPRTGALEIQLASPSDLSYAPDGTTVAIANVFGSQNVASVPAEVIAMEAGGLLPGSARVKRFDLMLSQNPLQAPGQNGYPYAIPPYFLPATVNNGIPFWHRPQTFSAVEFRKQEGTRAGSNMDLGLSVALDQYAYDTALINTFGSTGRIAPLSTRVGCRVRSVDFGSGADWWRPGIPLALALDSVTPALVVQLPQPVTLQPGDTFEVEALVPGPFFTQGFIGSQEGSQNAPNYALGISFNGYAAIKG